MYLAIILILALAFIVYKSCRMNIYLGFVQLVGSVYAVTAVFLVAGSGAVSIIAVGVLFTSVLVALFVSKQLVFLRKEYAKRVVLIPKSIQKNQVLILLLFLIPFYLALTPTILSGGWWNSISDRVDYMSNSSVFLRGIKLTPILIGVVLFARSGLIEQQRMILAVFVTTIFSLFLGSKSGGIFLVAMVFFYTSISGFFGWKALRATVLICLLFIFFLAFFFIKLGAASGGAQGEVVARVASDVLGYTRVFDEDFRSSCENFNHFSPVINTASKLLPAIFDKPLGHLSYGNCLAAPDSVDYPFELLVPLYFEFYAVYGGVFAPIYFSITACLIIAILNFTTYLGRLLSVEYIAFFSRLYLLIVSFGVFWGGKVGNYLVSEVFSVLFMLCAIGFLRFALSKGHMSHKFGC